MMFVLPAIVFHGIACCVRRGGSGFCSLLSFLGINKFLNNKPLAALWAVSGLLPFRGGREGFYAKLDNSKSTNHLHRHPDDLRGY